MVKHPIGIWRMAEIALLVVAACLTTVPHYIEFLKPLFPDPRFAEVYYFSVISLLVVSLIYSLWRGTLAAVFRGEVSKRDINQVGGIFVSLFLITLIHYAASVRAIYWHEIFQRAYYLPIIAAALWYGVQGGLLTAGLAAFLYLPHVVFEWHGFPTYRLNQFSETVLFFVFGALTGVLSDRQKRQKDKLEQTATHLSEIYAELQSSFESLRRAERMSALGRLSAGLAHEIRNSCGAVKGAAEIVTRSGVSEEDRTEFGAIISKELSHLDEILSHFLKFARPVPPRREPVTVRVLMSDVCRLVSEPAASHGVKVRCTEPAFPVTVRSLDPNQIKEVMLNLVLNAMEAMPEGGSVELWATKEGEMLKVHVKDEGTGVPEGDLQKIFDPFYTTKPSGTGLGLPTAYQIMQQHGGTIEVTRNPDLGMTFSLVFPLASEEGTKA